MVEEAMRRRRIEKIIRNTETHGTHYAGRYFNENIAETKRAKKKKKNMTEKRDESERDGGACIEDAFEIAFDFDFYTH